MRVEGRSSSLPLCMWYMDLYGVACVVLLSLCGEEYDAVHGVITLQDIIYLLGYLVSGTITTYIIMQTLVL